MIAFNAIIEYNACMQPTETRMTTLTIRNIDAALKERLRVRAAQHGQSMEAELRQILQSILREPERPPEPNLYERIRARFAPFGGVELELPPRAAAREPPRFD
ncbi:MAG: FitA-like ribbon-helix-helix domain-containing protein [Acetobacteraceae bacterium]